MAVRFRSLGVVSALIALGCGDAAPDMPAPSAMPNGAAAAGGANPSGTAGGSGSTTNAALPPRASQAGAISADTRANTSTMRTSSGRASGKLDRLR